MSATDTLDSFERSGWPGVFRAFILVPVTAVVVVLVARQAVAPSLATRPLPEQAIVGVVPGLLFCLLAYYFGGKGTVIFHTDHVEFRGRTMAYDDVAVAVRQDTGVMRLFGTATFDLFVPGETNLRMKYVKRPDEVEHVLDGTLAPPSEQLSEMPADAVSGVDGAIERRWQFWDYWQADASLPETAVVAYDDLKSVLEVGGLKVRYLDSVDMTNAEGLSDIDKNDVTSSNTNAGHP
jgi:hypothetical protein